MPAMMDKKHCLGCEDNFYNGNNSYGIKECWHLKNATVIARFVISVNAPMGTRANYVPVRRPRCFRQAGSVFLNEIPEYAR